MARESDLVPRVSEIAQLPADIDALHVLVAAARAERDAAIVERDHALSQIDRLRHLLRQLQRAQFGRVRRSSIPSSCFWHSRILNKRLPATRRPTTRRTQWAQGRVRKSAAPIAARFASICRPW